LGISGSHGLGKKKPTFQVTNDDPNTTTTANTLGLKEENNALHSE